MGIIFFAVEQIFFCTFYPNIYSVLFCVAVLWLTTYIQRVITTGNEYYYIWSITTWICIVWHVLFLMWWHLRKLKKIVFVCFFLILGDRTSKMSDGDWSVEQSELPIFFVTGFLIWWLFYTWFHLVCAKVFLSNMFLFLIYKTLLWFNIWKNRIKQKKSRKAILGQHTWIYLTFHQVWPRNLNQILPGKFQLCQKQAWIAVLAIYGKFNSVLNLWKSKFDCIP